MTRVSSFGRLLRQPGGLTAAQAVAAAEAQMADTRQEILAKVDAILAQIQASGVGREHAQPLHAKADEVASLAGLCGLPALGEAAYSLCELIARYGRAGRWNSDAVLMHLDSMRAIRNCADDAGSMLTALRNLVERVSQR